MLVRKIDGNLVFRFEVTLKDISPPIWRRFEAPGTMTLAQFHDALQVIMGWMDSHLHRFIISGHEYAPRFWARRRSTSRPSTGH